MTKEILKDKLGGYKGAITYLKSRDDLYKNNSLHNIQYKQGCALEIYEISEMKYEISIIGMGMDPY